MRVLLATIASIGLLGQGFQQESHMPVERISLDFEVGSIVGAVGSLSQATKIPMRVVGPVANETVFLHIQNRPFQEVMDQLAKVTHADWIKSSDGVLTLNRTNKRLSEEKTKYFQIRLKAIEKSRTDALAPLRLQTDPKTISKVVQEYVQISDRYDAHSQADEDNKEPFDEEKYFRRIRELNLYDPCERATARVLKALDLTELVNLPVNGTITYASQPNSIQRQLPLATNLAMKMLQSDQLEWSYELKKYPTKKSYGDDFVGRYDMDEYISAPDADEVERARTGAFSRSIPFAKSPVFTLVSIGRHSENEYRCTIRMFASDGSLVAELSSYDLSTNPNESLEPPTLKNSPKASFLTAAFWAINERNSRQVTEDIERSLRPYFDDPVKHDLLWFGNQELFAALAQEKNKSLIACVPDAMYKRFGGDNFEVYTGYEGFGSNLDINETSDWIVIESNNFIEQINTKINRHAFAAYAADFKAQGHGSLSAYLPTALTEGDQISDRNARDIIDVLSPSKLVTNGTDWSQLKQLESFSVPSKPALIKLFQSLSREQFGALSSGRIIPYRDLTSTQLEFARQIVFGTQTDIWVGGKAPNVFEGYDPTLELPGGILQGAGLAMDAVNDDVCLHYTKGLAGEYAGCSNLTDRKEEFIRSFYTCSLGVGPPSADSFVYELRTQRRWTLKCFLAPGHFIAGDFAEPINLEKVRRYPFDELTAETVEKMKKSGRFSFDPDSRFGGDGPPPPVQ